MILYLDIMILKNKLNKEKQTISEEGKNYNF